MAVTIVAVATKKLLFSTCDCTVDTYVGTADFSFMLGILNVCGHAYVRSHVYPDMDCISCVCTTFCDAISLSSCLRFHCCPFIYTAFSPIQGAVSAEKGVFQG